MGLSDESSSERSQQTYSSISMPSFVKSNTVMKYDWKNGKRMKNGKKVESKDGKSDWENYSALDGLIQSVQNSCIVVQPLIKAANLVIEDDSLTKTSVVCNQEAVLTD